MTILNMVYLKSSGGSGRPTITGFSYDNKNYNYGDSTYGDANAITFKPDGTKLYIVGETKNTVYQFSLSTPRDISTATYDNKSKSVSAQSTISESIIFSEDGLTMRLGGATSWSSSGGRIWKYTLSTAWDISTASYSNVTSNLSFGYPTCFLFGDNGKYIYQIYRQDNPNVLYRYVLTTPWDITTMNNSPTSMSLDNSSQPHGVVFSPDGTQMFILLRATKKISIYNLSTAWDLTTATQTGSYSISTPNSSNITSMCIDNDGNSMYLGGYNIGGIYQYTTTTA